MTESCKRFAVLSILFLAGLACTRTGTSTPPTPVTLAAGEMIRTVTHDGLERSYILYVPDSVNWSQPVPLVFVFHGGTGNRESAIRMSGFNEVADQNGFMVVYPNGTGRLSDEKLLTWNGGTCCGYAQEKGVDDVGFVRAVITDVQTLATIDEKRIYATGLSNGGILSHRLACEAADIFAAVAPVAGTLNFVPCQPAQPISVIEFHGTEDQHILYDGGAGPEALVDVGFASVSDSVEFWVSANACNPEPETRLLETTQHEVWTGCTDSTAVELYTIIGGGHAWPGGASGWPGADEPTQAISASQLIWEFFAAHPKS
jgi:polyhydroxybutyrate depolymerase